MLLPQGSPGAAGTRRLSGFPRARSLLWLWPGLEEGGPPEADAITASMFFSRGSWSSGRAIRCSRLSTESSPEARSLGLREGTPLTVEEVLSDDDLFRVGLQLVLSGSRWEGFSEAGWEPVMVCPALSLGGSGSFLGGRVSEVSWAENRPGPSVSFFRPQEFGLGTLQLPCTTALVKRFVCSSLLAGSELGVNPPRDKLGELSEQSICRGVCNPKASGLDSEGSRWTHCSSLFIKLLEGER